MSEWNYHNPRKYLCGALTMISLLIMLISPVFSQVSINQSGNPPHQAAMLDVQSNAGGFLPPRLSQEQMSAITNPPDGLIIFCNDCGMNGSGAFMGVIGGIWIPFGMCAAPPPPQEATHQVTPGSITWRWHQSPGATGYRWNVTNNLNTSSTIGTDTVYAEPGLSADSTYHRYVWAFNLCGTSGPTQLSGTTTSSDTSRTLTGYWHNWNDGNAPYVPLSQIDTRYKIINVAFGVPHPGTDYQIEFVPDQGTVQDFASQVHTLQLSGRKVVLSIGGATAPVSLDNTTERDIFVNTVTGLLNTYGFDGIDIDFEGSSLSISGGTIAAPSDPEVIHLIDAIKQIMDLYRLSRGQKMWLSFAPETAFVQGGMAAYGGIWGAYLPVLHALRDSIANLHVQLYNSGSMPGVNGQYYSQGTADFIISMTEAVIQGFNTPGGYFAGFPASKVSVGLPACQNAAGGGFCENPVIKQAVDYIMGAGNKPGTYTLVQPGGYPELKGMMTWSINWDAVVTCGTVYNFANGFSLIFD